MTSSGNAQHNGDTQAEQAAAAIRERILSGDLSPGLKLRIQELSVQFGYGLTPLREGLGKLVGRGLVEAIGQRGFRVVPISRKDLEDIQVTRHLVEVEALRMAMRKGDIVWEARILAALHRLQNIGTRARRELTPWGNSDFDRAHKEFHLALIAACGSQRLMALYEDLSDQVCRYRQVIKPAARSKAVSDRDHETLARLTLARDEAGAVAHLQAHIDLTLNSILAKSPAVFQQAMQAGAVLSKRARKPVQD